MDQLSAAAAAVAAELRGKRSCSWNSRSRRLRHQQERHGNKRGDMPIRDMRVYLRGACAARLPYVSTSTLCTPSLVRAYDASRTRGCLRGINRTAHRDTMRTFLCVPARGFAIILSITPEIGVIPQQRLAERWECTLIDKTTGTRCLGCLCAEDRAIGTIFPDGKRIRF